MNRLLVLLLLAGCASPATQEEEIFSLIRKQAAAWNHGDIPGFMAGYDRSPDLTFASGGTLTRGWEPTLARYQKRYDTKAKMGTLIFRELELISLEGDLAIVHGIWELQRGGDQPWGRFTLLLRHRNEGWRIVFDHTSSGE